MRKQMSSFRFRETRNRLPKYVKEQLYPMMRDCFPETYLSDTLDEFVQSYSVTPYRHFWIEDQKKTIIIYLKYNLAEHSLWNVCTDKLYRRQGFLFRLLDHALSVIRDRPVYLYVLTTNTIARKAYKKYGFRIVGQHEDAYKMMID